jgi:3-phenylpropionate/trans-cinnamate dioxygenase ferredoxin reductase subunit
MSPVSTATFIVAGAGQAGGWAAKTLREEGFSGRILLVGQEPHPPYERPPLSKAVLTGALPVDETTLFPADQLRALDIEVRPGQAADSLDPAARRLGISTGETLSYDRLLLCTGGRAGIPPIPGAVSRDVHVLRQRDDALRLKAGLEAPARRIVVIGGGWIGLEIAATARMLGHAVCVIEQADRVCARSVPLEVSARLAARHERQGVELLLATAVAAIEPLARGSRVRLADGDSRMADLIVLGTGLVPNDALAQAAGLACERGIRVDSQCRTSDPDIFAAGDAAVLHDPRSGWYRLESWQNAQDQGIAAARAMLDQPVDYRPVPLVWSEQYDVMIQIAGHARQATRTISRPLAGDERELLFGLDADDRVACVIGFNAGRDYRAARRFAEDALAIEAVALADPNIPLNTLAARAAQPAPAHRS